MHRLDSSQTRRIVLAGSLLALVTTLAGCGSQHTTEAAGMVSTRTASTETAEKTKPAEDQAVAAGSTTDAQADERTTVLEKGPHAATPSSASAVATSSKPAPANDDDSLRKKIVGKWVQTNEEKRTITVNDDGSASIIAELSDYRQYIVGKTLQFDVTWTLEDGKLTFVTTGGKPADSIKYITGLYGKTRVYRLIEFVEDRLVLKKHDTGEDEPDWTRLADK